jgi:hypothetical protein
MPTSLWRDNLPASARADFARAVESEPSWGPQILSDHITRADQRNSHHHERVESCAAKREPRCIRSSFRRLPASVQRPPRPRTLKRDQHGAQRDEHSARFILHQKMRRLVCVSDENEKRDLERRAKLSRRCDSGSCRQCGQPAGLIL